MPAALARYPAARDTDGFRALVEQHRGMVESTCAGVLGRRSPELDDAVQETFVKLARSADAIHGNVGAWLHRCARTTALDRWRSRRAARHDARPAPECLCADPDHAAAEQLEIVRECLAELPEHPRRLLRELFFEARSQRDVARDLGISHVAVQKRLVTALDMLRSRCVRRGVGAVALAALLVARGEAAESLPRSAGPSGAKLALVSALAAIIAGGIAALVLAPRPPAAVAVIHPQPPAPVAAREAPKTWIVTGDLPIELSADRAAFWADGVGTRSGWLRSARSWPAEAGPVTLRARIDLPASGRCQIDLAALFANDDAAASGTVAVYWQSAPMIEGPAAMRSCFSKLGDCAFILSNPTPSSGSTPILPVPPGLHDFAISVDARTVRTSIDGRLVHEDPRPPRSSLRFQVGVGVTPGGAVRPGAVAMTSLTIDEGR